MAGASISFSVRTSSARESASSNTFRRYRVDLLHPSFITITDLRERTWIGSAAEYGQCEWIEICHHEEETGIIRKTQRGRSRSDRGNVTSKPETRWINFEFWFGIGWGEYWRCCGEYERGGGVGVDEGDESAAWGWAEENDERDQEGD